MTAGPLRIGEVAARSGVSVDTVRHYERLGLIARAPRSAGGYRLFPPTTIERVRLIQNAVRTGFTLRQLSTFLRAREEGRPPCRQVRAAAGAMLEAIDRQMASLVDARAAVSAMLDEWDGRLASTPPGRPARLLEHIQDGTTGWSPRSVPRPAPSTRRGRT